MADPEHDYPLSPVLSQYERSLLSPPPDSVACSRCPNADWIIETVPNEFGDDTMCRAWCAALGRFMWPTFKVEACDARLRAIRAERPDDLADGTQIP